MYKVGLTGGIGSGKSTICDLFKYYATPIIDADEIAHALVMPGKKALSQISECFGQSYITDAGVLNRVLLRKIVFNDAEKKQQLESIMHPLIYAEIEQQLSLLTDDYCIIAIPLLIETKMQALVEHILVVDCTMEMQINRVKLRDQLNDTQIMTIINSQACRAERLTHADSVIYNTQDTGYLNHQVDKLHQKFLKQAK